MLLFLFLLFIPSFAFSSVVGATDSVDSAAFQSTLVAVFSAIAAVLVLIAFLSLALKWVIGLLRRG